MIEIDKKNVEKSVLHEIFGLGQVAMIMKGTKIHIQTTKNEDLIIEVLKRHNISFEKKEDEL